MQAATNLLDFPHQLIGRDKDRHTVCELVGQIRLLTVVGTGGIGKTCLVMSVTRDMAASFTEGAKFIDLSTVTKPEAVVDALVVALEIHTRHKNCQRASSLETLRCFLASRHMLLTLDNFEQIVTAAPLLSDLLGSCPKLHLLVTSRIPLRLRWEQQYPLAPLALPEHEVTLESVQASPAATLFKERARQVVPSFEIQKNNYDALARLCGRLDGLPLALELAAARIKLFSVQGLVEYLNGKNDLPGPPEPDRHIRHHSLEHTIQASTNLLSPSQQNLFCHLSVFMGSFDVAAVAAVAERGDVLEDLFVLTEHSLVQSTPHGPETRFRLLETLRAFAATKLSKHLDEQAVKLRHAQYYANLVSELTGQNGDRVVLFATFDAELPNVRAALDVLLASPEHSERGAQLVLNLSQYYAVRNFLSEGRHYLERALATKLSERIRGWLTYWLASYALELREFGKTETLLNEALELSKKLSGDWLDAACANDLGLLAGKRGESARAEAYFEEAILAYKKAGKPSVSPHINLGNLFLAKTEFTRAARYYRQALGDIRQATVVNKKFLLLALHNLGNLERLRGDFESAKNYLTEAVYLAQQLDNTFSKTRLLCLLSFVAVKENNIEEARGLLLEAFGLKPLEHNPVLNEEILYFTVQFAIAAQHHDVASKLYGAYLREQNRLGTTLSNIEQQLDNELREHLGIALDQQELLIAKTTRPLAEYLALGKQFLEHYAGLPNNQESSAVSTEMMLSPRETEVLACLAEGLSNKSIAKKLHLSPNTVKTHITSLFNKFGVNNRTQVVARAAKQKESKP